MVRNWGRIVWFSLEGNKTNLVIGRGFILRNFIWRGCKGHFLYSLSTGYSHVLNAATSYHTFL